jgi:hypothetical protein
MPVMAVVNKSYVPRGGDRIGFESQLLHAVIEKNAPIKNRLRYEIGRLVEEIDPADPERKRTRVVWQPGGDGDDRRCKVWATFKGEETPHEYTSETLKKMHPGHVTKDNVRYVKGSQLWDTNPEVQMFYSASRQWARLFAPDVLLGAYTPEELDSAPQLVDVTPKLEGLAQRLRDAKASHADRVGFDVDHVVREAAQRNSIIEGEANTGDAKQEATNEGVQGSGDELGGEGRGDRTGDRTDHGQDQGGSDHAGGGDPQAGEQPARVPRAGGKGEAKANQPVKSKLPPPKYRR